MGIKYLDEQQPSRIKYVDQEEQPSFLPGYQKTEQKIAQRPSAAETLQTEVEKPYDFSLGSWLSPTRSPGMKALVTGMKTLAVPYERLEGAVANVGMELQEEKTSLKELGKKALQGFTGERRGQLGDIPRRARVPEPVCAMVGFFSQMGMLNMVTKGKLVGSAKKAEQFIKSKTPRIMGKNYVLDRAKLADKGLDDLYSGLSKEYDTLYNKIGKIQVDVDDVQTVIDDLPTNVVNKISKSKLISKTKSGEIVPNLNNLKAIKGIIRKSVPDRIWSGKALGDLNSAQLEQSYGKINSIMAKGNPELQALNSKYGEFMQMRKTLAPVLYDGQGNVKANGLKTLFSKSGERGKQVFFEKFASQWEQGKQVMTDIIKFNRRQSLKSGLRKAAPWVPVAAGGGYMGSKWFDRRE